MELTYAAHKGSLWAHAVSGVVR